MDKYNRQSTFIRKHILNEIEIMVKDILFQIATMQPVSIAISNPKSEIDEVIDNSSKLKAKTVKLTRRDGQFMRYLIVLNHIYQHVLRGTYTTKRDIYYSHVNIFKTQAVTDQIVESLAATLRVNRNHLHILSSEKGLIMGPLIMKTVNSKLIDCSSEVSGYSIPQNIEELIELRSNAQFVLLIEKHTIFNYLIERGFHIRNKCIIITAKGFPDLGSRMLVKRLSEELKLKIYAIVDSDPYGTAVLLTYCIGSKNMQYLSSQISTPDIQWIGPHIEDIPMSHRLSLTKRDATMLSKLKDLPFINEQKYWKHHLIRMEELGHKAEIEGILDQLEMYIVDQINKM